MKKILFPILFLGILVLCFPLSALGAVMELTVNITSIQVPERAAMLLMPATGASAQEFAMYSSIITVAKNSDGSIVADAGFSNGGEIIKNASVTIPFPYDNTQTYKVYAEISANNANAATDTYCKADCTALPLNSGWYVSNYDLFLPTSTANNNGWANPCPNPPCGGPNSYYNYNIAFDPAHIVHETTIDGNYYWRSPALFTIN